MHDGRAAQHRGAHQHGAVDVIEGQEEEQHVALAQATGRRALDGVAHQVAVAEHDAFRQPGGAARVGQGDEVVLEVEGDLRRAAGGIAVRHRVPGRHSLRRAPDDQDVLDRGDARADGIDDRQAILVHHEHPRLGVIELIFDLLLVVGGVDRRDHAADLRGRLEADQVLGPVGHEQRDAVALGDAEIAQAVGQPVAQSFELAEGELLVVEHGGPLVGVVLRRAAQQLVVWNAGIVELAGGSTRGGTCSCEPPAVETAENFVAGRGCQG